VPAFRSTGDPKVGNRASSTSRFPAYPLLGAGGLSASGTGSLRLTHCEPPARDGRPSRPAQVVSGPGRVDRAPES